MASKAAWIMGVLISLPFRIFSADDPIGPLSERDVRGMLIQQGLDPEAQDAIIRALKQEPGKNEIRADSGDLQIDSILFTHGGNMAFFVDNDSWNFNAAVKYNGRLSKIKDLFEVYYWNGGWKTEISYKWIWIFLPTGTSLKTLDGSTFGGKLFGRGFSLSSGIFSKSPLQIEGGWVARENGIGNAFILAAKVGIGGGHGLISIKTTSGRSAGGQTQSSSALKLGFPQFMFPRLEFEQKKLFPDR